jgi:tripartite-type tricarboxylate transporter receptor subunit TctC
MRLSALAVTALAFWSADTAMAQTPWAPTERITYIVGVAPGGTVDLYARGIKNTLEQLKLTHNQVIVVENKVGAGGALALQQLKSNAGNAHDLGTFHTGAIAGAVTGLIKADPRDFTPWP